MKRLNKWLSLLITVTVFTILLSACGVNPKLTTADPQVLSADPAVVTYAVDLRETNEMLDAITVENMTRFGLNDSVQVLLNNYKNQFGDTEASKATVYKLKVDGYLSDDVITEINNALINAVAAYRSVSVAACSSGSTINLNNSYAYSGNKKAVYVVEISGAEKTSAVCICFFNGEGAISAATVPIFSDVSINLKRALSEYKLSKVSTPKLTKSQAEEILSVLANTQYQSTLTVNELINRLVSSMAADGNDMWKWSNGLVAIPPECKDLCQKCALLNNNPQLCVKWDLQALDMKAVLDATAYSDDNFANYYMFATNMNYNFSTQAEIIAQSTMRITFATPSLNAKDSVYWIYCVSEDEDEGCVCAVTILKNKNNCYEVTAVPIYNDEIYTLAVQAAGGSYSALNNYGAEYQWLAVGEFISLNELQ